MATEFIKLDKTILYVIKMIKNQHQRTDIKRIFDYVTKTTDVQHITKDSLDDRVNQPLQSNKLINKINHHNRLIFLE